MSFIKSIQWTIGQGWICSSCGASVGSVCPEDKTRCNRPVLRRVVTPETIRYLLHTNYDRKLTENALTSILREEDVSTQIGEEVKQDLLNSYRSIQQSADGGDLSILGLLKFLHPNEIYEEQQDGPCASVSYEYTRLGTVRDEYTGEYLSLWEELASA